MLASGYWSVYSGLLVLLVFFPFEEDIAYMSVSTETMLPKENFLLKVNPGKEDSSEAHFSKQSSLNDHFLSDCHNG